MPRAPAAALLIAISLWVSGFTLAAPSPGQPALERSGRFYREGRYEEALAELLEAVELDPGLLRAWIDLGWTYLRLEAPGEARRVWELVIKVDPENGPALSALAGLLIHQGDLAGGIALYEEGLAIAPADPRLIAALAECLASAGDEEGAICRLERARADPRYDPLLDPGAEERLARLLIDFLERMGRVERAEEVAEETLRRSPSLAAEMARRLGRLEAAEGDRLYGQRDFHGAEERYRAALLRDGASPRVLLNLGWSLERQGRNEEAVGAWSRALALGETAALPPLSSGLRALGRLAEAEASLEESLGLDPPETKGVLPLVADLFAAGEAERALEWIGRLLASEGGDRIWSNRAARTLAAAAARRGDPGEGIETAGPRLAAGAVLFRGRLDVSSDPLETARALGFLEWRLAGWSATAGRFPEAIELYRRALGDDPGNRPAWKELGWLQWQRLDFAACLEVWEEYLRRFPDEPEPWGLLARAHLWGGDAAIAAACAEESLRRDPSQGDVGLVRIRALLAAQRFGEARELADCLALEHPLHRGLQIVRGEILMSHHDFLHGEEAWSRVVSLYPALARARYYLAFSLQELSRYEEARQAALAALQDLGPVPSILRFLADDAGYRGDREESILWLSLLTEAHPEELAAWIRLVKLRLEAGDRPRARADLARASARHSRSLKLRLLALEIDGRSDPLAAWRSWRALAAERPANSEIFQGGLEALVAAGRRREAIELLDREAPRFLKDIQIEQRRAILLGELGESAEARRILENLAEPPEGTRYVPILLYHGLARQPRSASLPATIFAEQMGALRESGYRAITVGDLERMREGREPFPARPILITFDDARRDSLELADPVLERFGFRATLFVPTGKLAEGHPFFADGAALRACRATGRWELQAHGHQAHDRVPVDAEGTRGTFLVNRRWIAEAGRAETPVEFRRRIEDDAVECLRRIEREVPGSEVIGYAYPFNEAGQEEDGNEPEAAAWNGEVLRRHYRFGFIQDPSGYNRIRIGEPGTLLLRRRSMARPISGAELVRQLSERHPANLAAVEGARTLGWRGFYSAARAALEGIEERDRSMGKEIEYQLAQVAFQEGLPREAEQRLERAGPRLEEARADRLPLAEQVAWELRPRLENRFSLLADSDHRMALADDLILRHRLRAPLELAVEMGLVHFQERGEGTLLGQEDALSFSLRPWEAWILEGKGRQRFFEGGGDSQNGWISGAYRGDFHQASLAAAYEDVETLPAHRADLQSRNLGGSYLFRRFQAAQIQTSYLYRDYEDGNERNDFSAGVSSRLASFEGWSAGLLYTHSDTLFRSPRYYSPEQLNQGLVRLLREFRLQGGSSLELGGGVGPGHDETHGYRWAGEARARAIQIWSERLRSSIEAQFGSSPGYQSFSFGVGVEWGF